MSNFSRGRNGMLGRNTRGRNGTVTIIEEPIMRNYARMAKVTFWVVLISSALLAELISVTMLPVFWSIVVALLTGFVVGSVASAVVIAWPVLRVIWWWLPEIAITVLLVGAANAVWFELTWHHVILALRVITIVLALGTPAAIPASRRYLMSLAWCLITRHRIRTCFSEFIITNRYGTLPLILWAKPTPAGERLWIVLRPGLAVTDVQDRADQIAVACWATSVVITVANPSNSAVLRIDVKRRDPLATVTSSPLIKVATGFIPRFRPQFSDGPAALDLTDVTPEDVTPAKTATATVVKPVIQRPKWPDAPASVPPASEAKPDEDISDWI